MKYFFFILLFSICINANAIDRFCNGAPTTIQANGGGNVALTAMVDSTVFVGPSAAVCEYAMVFGSAQIKDNSRVYGQAQVADGAIISGNVEIFGNASLVSNPPASIIKVSENAKIYGNASVTDAAIIKGSAKVFENSRVSLSATVDESGQIYGNATATDASIIKGSARIHGNAFVGLNVVATGTTDLCTLKNYSANTVLTNFVYCLDPLKPVPTVISITPNNGPIIGGTLVEIVGTNFMAGDIIFIGGVNCSSVVILNSTTVKCVTPSHSAGAVNVVVTNVDSKSGVLSNSYTYNTPPSIDKVSTSGGALAGGILAGGTQVKIEGNNFVIGTTVNIGGLNCLNTNVLNPSIIICDSPPHSAGIVSIKVTNPDGQVAILPNAFTYRSFPVVINVSPKAGVLAGNTDVIITGSNFIKDAIVDFGSSVCTNVKVITSTKITCTTSAHAANLVDVTVTNTDSQSGVLTNGFFYLGLPTITSIAPNEGPLAGGTKVTLSGTNFFTDALVKIGGAICTSPKILSPTALECVLPSHSAGSVDVVVTNLGTQTATLINGYSYVSAPVVASVSPDGGPLAGGVDVRISVSNFILGATVSFGGSDCGNVTIENLTTIKCKTSAHIAGETMVTITNPDGQFGNLIKGYTYRALPTVTSVSPNAGAKVGGTSVEVFGTGFIKDAVVDFNGESCINVEFLSSTRIRCKTTAHIAETVNVRVTNSDGQSGIALNAYTFTELTLVTEIITGLRHTCAILQGYLRCWGENSRGQLGLGYESSDLTSPPNANIINGGVAQVAVGGNHTCAVMYESGKVRCWGGNTFGQLGYANTTDLSSPGGDLPIEEKVFQIALGADYSCALLATFKVRCWGRNNYGQLGYGNTTDLSSPGGDINLGDGVKAYSIKTSSSGHTCATLSTGKVSCWGWNAFGQLGYGNTIDLLSPGEGIDFGAEAGILAAQIAIGNTHTCVLLSNKKVRCWGYNNAGQLGYGNHSTLLSPGGDIDLGPISVFKPFRIALGGDSTCVLFEDGNVRCWGRNNYGQLGYGNTIDLFLPGVNINLGGLATQISAGHESVCARLTTSAVRCWGRNSNGQLGYGNKDSVGDDELPYSVGGVSTFTNRSKKNSRKNYVEVFQNNKEKYWSDNE